MVTEEILMQSKVVRVEYLYLKNSINFTKIDGVFFQRGREKIEGVSVKKMAEMLNLVPKTATITIN